MRGTGLSAIFVLTLASGSARADEPSSETPGTPSGAVQTAPGTPPGAVQTAPGTPDSVYLHVESTKPVTIEREDGAVVCTSPCDSNVPVSARYRVGGHRPSPEFVLNPPSNGRADLRVKTGSKTAFWLGAGGLGVGTGLIAGGIVTLVAGYNNRAPVQGANGVDTDNRYTDAMILGTTLIIGGVFLGLWGGATVLSNMRTSVRGDMHKTAKGGGARPILASILTGTF